MTASEQADVAFLAAIGGAFADEAEAFRFDLTNWREEGAEALATIMRAIVRAVEKLLGEPVSGWTLVVASVIAGRARDRWNDDKRDWTGAELLVAWRDSSEVVLKDALAIIRRDEEFRNLVRKLPKKESADASS